MQIKCPHCKQRFNLPDGFLPPDGDVLDCPGCDQEFFALPSGLTRKTAGAPMPTPQLRPPPATIPPPVAPAGTPYEMTHLKSAASPGIGSPAQVGSPVEKPSPYSAQASFATAMPGLEPGVELGKYVIKGVLGRGGFGTVYEADDTTLGEVVALKVVPAFGDAQQLARQLAGEFRAQRGIKQRQHILEMESPSVAPYAGVDWILMPMERAERSLRDWLTETKGDLEGRLEQGLEFVRQACKGVQALHEAGVVHLDIKPENLLLVRESQGTILKVADFGLARNLQRLDQVDPSLMRDGIGTPYYMAPEQIFAARQKDVGPEADVYAVGIVLYELLDGDPPFDGLAEQIRRKHRELEPPELSPELPIHISSLALKCLEKRPSNRPQIERLLAVLGMTDLDEWQAFVEAKKVNSAEAWRGFIEAFPNGQYSDEAGEMLMQFPEFRKALRNVHEATQRGIDSLSEETERTQLCERSLPTHPEPLQTWTNPRDGLEYVFIPPGQFEMGASPGDGDALDCEKPRHKRSVATGFWVGVTPITVQAYRRFCDEVGRLMPEPPGFNPDWVYGDHPIVNVSIYDAHEYSRWSSARLPSEAEWEYVARAGTGWRFWWGHEFDSDSVWWDGNSSGSTHPVRKKLPNPWGLYDVLGQVEEWCDDGWHNNYEGAPLDARGDKTWNFNGDTGKAVARGGCFSLGWFYMRVSNRSRKNLDDRGHQIGFRCVIDIE